MSWRMIYSFLRLAIGGGLIFGALGSLIYRDPIIIPIMLGGLGLAIVMQETAILTARYLKSPDSP